MNYKTSASLLARGARWGDIECLEEGDILLDLEKRRVEIEEANARRLQFRKTQAQASQAAASQAAASQAPKPPKPTPQYHPKPFRRDFRRDLPKCLPKCIGCKKFTIHSNPPAHFTEEDKNYCCAYCKITGGKKHGGSCERQS